MKLQTFVVLNINLYFICKGAKFLSEIVFFGDTYVNLPVLLVTNALFSEIPFSKVNSVFQWSFSFHSGAYHDCKQFGSLQVCLVVLSRPLTAIWLTRLSMCTLPLMRVVCI